MTFGPEYEKACVSTFSTPVHAFTPITTINDNTPLYEFTSYSYPSVGSPVSTLLSSTTTIATGLAVADPVTVAWKIEDIGTFPSDYVQSLVQRFGVAAPSNTTVTTSDLPEPTNIPTSNGISTGAKAGVGIGVALAAVIVGGLIIFWCLKRRRKPAATTNALDTVIPEMEDQDYSHSQRKWFFGGRWRNEVDAQAAQNELDSKTVHVVPGPPAELEAPATSDASHNDEAKIQRADAEDRLR
jgi:hypothetical protein